MNYYRNKVAVVTGGAAGIGAELVRQLASAGASVVIADLNRQSAQTLADELNDRGAKALACETDVRRFEDVQRAVEIAVAEFGHLDLIVNNAGVGLAGELRDLDLTDWAQVIDVNLWGVVHGVHAALPVMLAEGHGQIVNMASAAGLTPRPGMAPYAATKHAVVGLSTSLRYEVEDLGVRVNVVCPFMVDTSIFKKTIYRNIDREAFMADVPVRLLPVERCAAHILRGAHRNQAVITTPLTARLGWWLYRWCPPLASLISRRRRALFRKHRIVDGIHGEPLTR